MKENSITFGQFLGIPLRVHLNWFVIAVLVTWSLSAGYFPQENPGRPAASYWIAGFITAILFFGSVLAHELGHAWVALREGVPVKSITLFIFGGIAHIAHEPETAGSEFRIVISGPLASLVLAVLFHVFGLLVNFSPELSSSAIYLSRINAILAVFNLLPGFPLDGGRILRSIFWKWKNDFIRATRWAMNAGLAVSILFILTGLFMMFRGSYFGGLWIAFIGWYLSTASRTSYQQAMAENAELEASKEEGPVHQPVAAQSATREGEARTGQASHVDAPMPAARPDLLPRSAAQRKPAPGVLGTTFAFLRVPGQADSSQED